MDETPPEPGRRDPRRHPLAAAFSIGTELVVAVLLGVFAGRWADARLGTEPLLLLAGVFVGISVGLYLLIRGTRPPGAGGA